MDELSWRARLAKSNINILNIDNSRWYYEFMYHPKPGQTKWCKTYYEIPMKTVIPDDDPVMWYKELEKDAEKIAEDIRRKVLDLRKELEA